MANRTRLIGLARANTAIKRLPSYALDEAQTVATVTAVAVSSVASTLAPRSEDGSHGNPAGFLSRSILWRAVRKSKRVSAIVGIAKAAFYWKFLEYGTRKMSAQPFVRPAADGQRDDHARRMKAGLARASDRIKS